MRYSNNISQICHEAYSVVMANKNLWNRILRSEVAIRGLHLPAYLQTREQIDASCMESWIRSAITLQKRYDKSSYITSKAVGLLWITWIKLVRGRWCIVASSDLTQSHLSIYDGKDGLSCRAQFFFDGPVMDGQLEDTPTSINMALTIGSK